MKRYLTPALAAMSLITLASASCSSKKNAVADEIRLDSVQTQEFRPAVIASRPVAVIYRTEGDCRYLVPVNVADGRLISYPDPSDITEESSPLPLADGYWLDRRGGVGDNTRFTKWTYAEYRKLNAAPSTKEILANLNPAARVTQVVRLNEMTPQEAAADTAAVNAMIRALASQK